MTQQNDRLNMALAVRLMAAGLLVAAMAHTAITQSTTAGARPPLNLARFRAQVDSFAILDKAMPTAPGGIVFVGSSIFRQWSALSVQMTPLPVLNRAFGGSQTPDQLHFIDRTILPYRPRVIVYYCGSNDFNAGEEAGGIASRFIEFVRRVRAELPATRIIYASVLRAPDKRVRWPGVDSTNAAVRAYAATDPLVTFVDLNPAVFDAKGEPRLDLYRPDQLHYFPPAYELFTAILRPVMEREWTAATGKK